MRKTYPGKWMYNEHTVTDQNPLEIAKMCIWEKILDRTPNDIPYIVKIVIFNCFKITYEMLLLYSHTNMTLLRVSHKMPYCYMFCIMI